MADSERRTEWTYTRVSGTNGEPNILIELSNEMDSVPLASDGVTSLSSTITSDVTMYKGLTELPATFTLTQSGNYATITRQGNTNTYTLSVVIPQSVTLTNDKYDVVITGTYGAYTRDRTFTVQGVRAGADGEGAVQYSLVPSVTTVNKDNSGQYSVPSVTCSVLRTLNDTRSLVDLSSTQDLVLKYLLDSSTTETIYSTAISTSSFTTQLTFRLYYQNILVDSETIPLLTDGEDGTSVLAKYSTTSSTAEESLWHTPFVSGDVWMRVSEDDGVSWGAPIRIVGENGADGTSPYSCSVSNENFTVATGTDLKPLSATTYSVRFQAYKGSTQLTAIAPSATIASGKFKVSTPTTAGFTVAQSTAGTLTFTTATGTAISANISTNVTVTYDNGSTETKTITISASKTGAQGTAAMFVSIEAADGLVFKNSSPSQLSLRCVATGFTPSSYQWYKDGTAITSATSQTYNATSAGVYKVTSNGYSDFVTVISVSDGEDGHSPVITASKQNGTTTISSDGTAIATIVDGDDGVDDYVVLTKESFSVKCTTDRKVMSATSFVINFRAFSNSSRISCYCTAPSDFPVTPTITNTTTTTDGQISFTFPATSNLGGTTTAYDSKYYTFTFSLNNKTITKQITITKDITQGILQCDLDNVDFMLTRTNKANQQSFSGNIYIANGTVKETLAQSNVSFDVSTATNVSYTKQSIINGNTLPFIIYSTYNGAAPTGYITITVLLNGFTYSHKISVSSTASGKYLGVATNITSTTSVTIKSTSIDTNGAETDTTASITANMGDFITAGTDFTSSSVTFEKGSTYQLVNNASSSLQWVAYESQGDNAQVFSDIIGLAESSSIGMLFAKRLASVTGFIRYLFSEVITVLKYIKSDNMTGMYNEITQAFEPTNESSGFALDKAGNVFANQLSVNGMKIKYQNNELQIGRVDESVNYHGDFNIKIGQYAGCGLSGSSNTVVGYEAMSSDSIPTELTGINNIAIGTNAGNQCGTSNNVLLGYYAGYNIHKFTKRGSWNSYTQYYKWDAVTVNSIYYYCIQDCTNVYPAAPSGADSYWRCFLHEDGENDTEPNNNSYNVVIGSCSGSYAQLNESICIGYRAMYGNSGTHYLTNMKINGSIAIGNNALAFTDGYSSDKTYTRSTNDIVIGNDAMRYSVLTENNIAIGTSALKSCNNSIRNIAIGTSALGGSNSEPLYNNIAIGYESLNSNSANILNTVAIGTQAAMSIREGNDNVYIGYHAGATLTHAYNSVAIGSAAAYNSMSVLEDSIVISPRFAVSEQTIEDAVFIGPLYCRVFSYNKTQASVYASLSDIVNSGSQVVACIGIFGEKVINRIQYQNSTNIQLVTGESPDDPYAESISITKNSTRTIGSTLRILAITNTLN